MLKRKRSPRTEPIPVPLSEQRARRRERRLRLAAFFVPVVIFYLVHAIYGLFPFGSRHLLTVDLYHQYAPFLVEMGQKLRSADTFFFSWSGGLGTSFFPLFTYYLASPVNLIMLFVPLSAIAEAVTFIIVLKIGLMGLTCYILLTQAFRRRDGSAVLFAAFYAVSNYVLAYHWNIMWLDTLVLLPLVVLGLHRLIREDKKALYVTTLTAMLMFHYYTAFFGCLFLAFYAMVLLVQYTGDRGWRYLLFKLTDIFAYTVLALLLAAVVILPTYKGLAITSAAGDKAPAFGLFANSLFDHLGQLEILREPNVMGGLPNLYAGLAAVLLIPYYFLDRNRPIRTRIAHLVLLVFLFFSTYSAMLDFIWHGMHYPNSLNHRYAFVIVLYLLMLAYQALPSVRRIGSAPALVSGGMLFAAVMLREWQDKQQQAGTWRVLASAVLIGLYLIALTAMARRERSTTYAPPTEPTSHRVSGRRAAALFFVAIMALELVVNVRGGVYDVQQLYPLGDRVHYTANDKSRAIAAKIADIKTSMGDPYVRMEMVPDSTVNDPMLYSSNGLTIFASTFQHAPIDYMNKLGYPTNGVNSFQYSESGLLMDSLLGIRFLFRPSGTIVKDTVRRVDDRKEHYTLYENERALPLAYFIKADVETFETRELPDSPYEAQNLMNRAMGGADRVYVPQSLDVWGKEGCELVKQPDSDVFSFTRHDDATDWAFMYAPITETGTYALGWRDINAGIRYVNGFIHESTDFFSLGGQTTGMIELGELEAGDDVHFRIQVGKHDQMSGQFRAYLVKLDEAALDRSVDYYAAHAMTDFEQTSRHFSGTVNAPERGYVFVSTHWHPGWKVTVNGESVGPVAMRGAFMLIPVEAGVNEIVATFTPPGFFTGLAISLATLIFCVIMSGLTRRRAKQMTAASTEQDAAVMKPAEISDETNDANQASETTDGE